MNAISHFIKQLSLVAAVLLCSLTGAVAQQTTMDFGDIEIPTDIVAPVVSTADAINDSVLAGSGTGTGADGDIGTDEGSQTAPAADQPEPVAVAQDTSPSNNSSSGNIFENVPAENIDSASVSLANTISVTEQSSVVEPDTSGSSIFSEIEIPQSDQSVAYIQESVDVVTDDQQNISTAVVQQPMSESQLATDNMVTSEAVDEPESVEETVVTETSTAPDPAADTALTQPEPVSSEPAETIVDAAAVVPPAPQIPNEQQQLSIDEDEIILGWATAWSNNDVETYLGYYADDFVPAEPNLDRQSWEKIRRERLQNENIRIIVSNAELVRVESQRAQVQFTQRYTSKTYRDRVIKAIEMENTGDGWKFISERTVEELPFK